MEPAATRLTYAELCEVRERSEHERDDLELLDGALYVTPAPSTRHERAVARLVAALLAYERAHGGAALPSPDVYCSATTVLRPDALFVRAEHLSRVEDAFVRGAPDLVVEVSSPSTRSHDLLAKRRVYEQAGVPEFWFVDLESDRIELHERGADGLCGPPTVVEGDGHATSTILPGFSVAVAEATARDASTAE